VSTFQITAPDGRKFRVEGATAEGALAALKKYTGVDQTNTALDVAKSIGSGLVEGAEGVIGLPGDAQKYLGQMMTSGIRAVHDRLLGPGDPADRAARDRIRENSRIIPTSEEVGNAVSGATAFTPYRPQTTVGRYAHTAATFVPGALAGGEGTLAGLGRAAVKYGVVPGVASEWAGQATEGTPIEPAARTLAAIGAGGLSAALSRPSTPAQALRTALPRGMSEADVASAGRLISDATRAGISLTWPEALSQVTGGRVDLTDLQRFLEQSTKSRGIVSEVMADRPRQIRQATEPAIDAVAGGPPRMDPVRAGLAVRDVSVQALDTIRKRINGVTEALYQRGGQAMLPDGPFNALNKDPLFKQALTVVRNDPVRARFIAGYPDRSVAVLNEIKKHLDDLASSSAVTGNNTASSVYGGLARDVRGEAAKASPEYRQALETQRRLRGRYLEPAEAGALGQMAKTNDLQRQANFLLDRATQGSDAVAAQAIKRIYRHNPDVAGQLVHARVKTIFDEATRSNIGGENAWGGAKFVSQLVGNNQNARNLQAVVMAMPNGGQRWAGFRRMLDILEATGKRPRANSATDFNRRIGEQLERGGVAGEAASLAASPGSILTQAREVYRNFRLGRNTQALARIITDPESGNLFRQLLSAKSLSDRERVVAQLVLLGHEAGWRPLEINVPVPAGATQ
jgi:hypothetical protein